MEIYDADGNPIDMGPTPVPWAAFEQEVAECLSETMQSWFGLKPDRAQVKRCPRYYSQRRMKEIIFDVAVEIYPAGSPATPALIWLFECKDYPDRRVPVDDVEEFWSKMEQVDAHKGTIVTRLGFQQGAIDFAKSCRIGLMTLQKQEFMVVHFSMNSDDSMRQEIHATSCLFPDGTIREANCHRFRDSPRRIVQMILIQPQLVVDLHNYFLAGARQFRHGANVNPLFQFVRYPRMTNCIGEEIKIIPK